MNFLSLFFTLILVFIISFSINYYFIKNLSKIPIFLDPITGTQKFHQKPVPRIGGAGIFLSILIVCFINSIIKLDSLHICLFLLVSSFPVFYFGFLEDILKNIPPKKRLLASFVSALLSYYLLDAKILRTDVIFLDFFLQFSLVSLIFTTIALAGVTNAFNIIDGFNGLASGIGILILTSYAFVAYKVEDFLIFLISLICIFSILGFFILNYPDGKIFLGDCGAYSLGFWTGILGIMLVNRNPEVSPWFVMVLLIYPVWETLFSIYRRKFVKSLSPYEADKFHMHQLLYKRLLKEKHVAVAPILWVVQIINSIFSIIFFTNSLILVFYCFIFILIYVWFYKSFIYFKLYKFKFC